MRVAVVCGLAAAFFNAVNMMTQHAASLGARHRKSGWRIALHHAADPLWLIGVVAAAVGFLVYSIALHHGPLAVVQPLLVTELVSALILRRLWIRQQVGPRAWAAADRILDDIKRARARTEHLVASLARELRDREVEAGGDPSISASDYEGNLRASGPGRDNSRTQRFAYVSPMSDRRLADVPVGDVLLISWCASAVARLV